MPSVMTMAVTEAKAINPAIILDEIDKTATSRYNGSITDELLSLLEPAEPKLYEEKFLATSVDASHINWFLTANSTETIPMHLMSRCTLHRVEAPTPEQIPLIIRSLVKGDAAGVLHSGSRRGGSTDKVL